MGFFSGLFSKKPKLKREPDKVWIKSEFKFTGMMDYVKTLQTSECSIVLTTFFKDTFDKVLAMLNEKSFSFHEIDTTTYYHAANKIHFVSAELLNNTNLLSQIIKHNQNKRMIFVFAEHYPILSKEKILEDKITALLPETGASIMYFSALDEPLFAMFGNQNIVNLMQKMGMKDDEMLEHALITKSIESAQKKVEEKITTENKTDKSTDWFKQNRLDVV